MCYVKEQHFCFGCSKAYCTLEKKKINHFRNKSIPIEENCQYFPELSYTLVLLLYILSYVLILIGTTQFMLKYNYNVWLFFVIERCILPWNHFSFRTIHEIKIKRNKNFSIFVIEVSSFKTHQTTWFGYKRCYEIESKSVIYIISDIN